MSAFVHPDEVKALVRDLGEGIRGLPPGDDRAALAKNFAAWVVQIVPVTWLNAPDILKAAENFATALRDAGGPDLGGFATGAAPVAPVHGMGPILPGDVLAYRKTWDAYVTGVARAAEAGAALFRAPASLPGADDANRIADTLHADSVAIMLLWNDFANTPDDELVLGAADILQDYQRTVLKVAQFYEPEIAGLAPTVTLPALPTIDVQSQVIGRIEGLGILAHGVLQLIGEAAGGAVEELGGVGTALGNTAKALAGPGPWIAIGLAAGVALLVTLRK